MLATAQTGTGKTASFVLPLLQRLMTSAPSKAQRRQPVRALILVPTRELALQVDESIRNYGSHVPISGTAIFGGVGMNPQREALRDGRDIIVATPGRLLDHVARKTVDLGTVEILVLDEADRMLDMGFIHEVKRLLRILPTKRQNLLFSATFSAEIQGFSASLLKSPRRIEATPRNITVEAIKQVIHHVDSQRKPEVLADLIHRGGWVQVLVFGRTKHGVDRLARKLERSGVAAAAIHGNKSQSARIKALTAFKTGKIRVLVATDIAARGLDIDGLPHVVNFELPHVPEDYVHRIGRTGRAGASGEAVSLVSPDERPQLRSIERLLGVRLVTPEQGAVSRSADATGRFDSSKKSVAVPRSRHRATPAHKRVRARPPKGGGKRADNQHSRDRAGEEKNRPCSTAPHRALVPNLDFTPPIGRKEFEMATGNVKWFNPAKGFGFIAPEDNSKDVFVHISAVERAGLGGLVEGQRVEFDVVAGRDGRGAAENLRLMD